MSQSLVTDAGTLIIPGSYASYTVKTDNSGLATSGVLMLVGEAEIGPDYSLEDDLESNGFGPNQADAVVSKYKSGPLVDAYRFACAPANDENIVGAPSRIVLVKTNAAVKAKAPLLKYDSTTYGYLADKSYGKLGNLISATVTAKATEVIPTTGSFTFIPSVGTVSYTMRANGAATVGGTLGANVTPTVLVSTVAALAGVIASGGAARAIPTTGTIALAIISGNTVQIDVTTAFSVAPVAGDTVVIPDASIIEGTSNSNIGAYVVISATTTSIVATKLSDAGKPSAVAGTITAPTAVTADSLTGSDDILVYTPVTITLESGDPLPGVGKSLEINETTSGADLLSRTAFVLGTTTPVTWVSKTGAAKLLSSATEYAATLTVARQFDAFSQDLSSGGEIALKLGYTGTTASVVIDDSTMTITRTDGDGADLSITLADFNTLADLATFISSKTGYSCSVGNGILGQLPPTALDDGTFTAGTTFGGGTLRLKVDGYKFFKKLAEEAFLVQLQDSDGDVVAATAGIPAPLAITYLTGGVKGGTTAAAVAAAITACEKVRGNFLVPLFSRDYGSDISDSLTESTSTYTIAGIHTAARTHVLKMSTLKRRGNRQAILSYKGTFAEAKEVASNLASFRCLVCFQDTKNLASDGTIKQFQPWSAAVIAAGMQAAGNYRALVGKIANVSGVLQAAKDFDPRDIDQLEEALLAGLMPMRKADGGGFEWVSDQTSYGKDSNFLYNSLQAVYVADIIAMTLAVRLERAFKGQSLADVSAGLIVSFIQTVMEDFKKLKFTAASDDAVLGYKNLTVKISGPAAITNLEVKIAGCLYFLPVSFAASPVQQSA